MKKRRFNLDLTPMEGLDVPITQGNQGSVRWLRVFFFLIFVLVTLRLVMVHLNPGNMLTEEERLHIGEIQLTEPRGEIFDRNGVVLATNSLAPSLWVDPRLVALGDEEVLSDYLSRKIGMTREEVAEKLVRNGADGKPRKFNMIKRWIPGLTEADIEEIRSRSGGAVSMIMEPVRTYPHHDTVAHLLGFVNRSGEASEGLERSYDKHLGATPGVFRAKADNGRRLLSSGTQEYTEATGGEMLQLTIDVGIQHSLEAALDERIAETQSVAAMGIIMDPRDGAILALATRPAFDPNEYDKVDAQLRKNRAVIDVFEPGSAFKIVTAAAALEHGLVKPETMIDCENGAFNPYGHRIKDAHKMGILPFRECFAHSSNIAMIKVAAMLGEERLEEWIRKFGFGKATSPDFAFESRGLFQPRKNWSRLTMGSLPMGQEISVTMPQLGRSYAAIANGGYLVQPYYVERAVARDGKVTYQHQAPPPQRILSPETARTMQELSHGVVLRGTGTAANIMEYRVGGKTGTAQIARLRSEGGGYKPGAYTTVFAGFAPLGNPRLVAVIVIEEPTVGIRYGGTVCGPVFAKVMRSALVRLGVPEDPVTDPEVVAAHEKQQKIALAAQKKNEPKKKEIALKPSDPTDEADADTVAPPPGPDALDASLDALIAPLDGLELVARHTGAKMETAMPDLHGLTKRQARERLQRLGVPLDAQGAGWVVGQNPPPGASLEDVTVCALRFSPKGEMLAQEQQPPAAEPPAAAPAVPAVADPQEEPQDKNAVSDTTRIM
jgi:stage V sporulation protein D (sporulation-specific penicillin-binding protein)